MCNLTIHDISLSSWNIIHKAAYCGNYAALEEELNSGANPNFTVDKFESKLTPLFSTQKITVYFDNMTPIYIATVMGHTDCVRLLLARGADPTIKARNTYYNMSSCSALTASLWFGNFKCYRLMKNHINYKSSGDSSKKYLLAS